MYATLIVTDERPFQVHAEWLRPQVAVAADPRIRGFDGRRHALERNVGRVERSSHGRGQIARNAARGEGPFYRRECIGVRTHQVVPRATADMDVNETGRQDVVAEVDFTRPGRQRDRITGSHGNDAAIFDHNTDVGNDSRGRERLFGCNDVVHNVPAPYAWTFTISFAIQANARHPL